MRLGRLRQFVVAIRAIEKIAKENELSVGTTASVLCGLYEARTGKLVPHETVGLALAQRPRRVRK